jgi:hypothetical protein
MPCLSTDCAVSEDVIVLQLIICRVSVQTVLSQKPERQSRDVGPVIYLLIILNKTQPGDMNSGFYLWQQSVLHCVHCTAAESYLAVTCRGESLYFIAPSVTQNL